MAADATFDAMDASFSLYDDVALAPDGPDPSLEDTQPVITVERLNQVPARPGCVD